MGQAMAQMAQAEDKASAGEIYIDAEPIKPSPTRCSPMKREMAFAG